MKLSAIAAVGKQLELGYKNDMPWKRALKKDLEFFKEQTMNHPVVMGRKTFESIGKPLPGRENIVISASGFQAPGVRTFPSFEAFLQAFESGEDEVFVIGGASLYKQALPFCERLILSEIDQEFDHDCSFPSFDASQYKKTVLEDVFENGLSYQHVMYDRISDPFCG